jgi:tellurite resistance protein TerC
MELAVWIGFILFFISVVMIDLGLFHQEAHAITFKRALIWTALWVSLAMVCNVGIYFLYENGIMKFEGEHGASNGRTAAMEFLSGYLLEYSLSMDNLFIIAMIISAFKIPAASQHRLLFWGIFSAAVLRGIMIGLGATLIHQFHWMEYVFGAIILYSAFKMLGHNDDEIDPDNNSVVNWSRKFFNVTSEFDGANFWTKKEGVSYVTPMFLALLMIEFCDVMFAFDSIPAIFSITKDPFIVFSSNMFAILGLRSLYFALAGLISAFKYLKYSLIVLLVFVGLKFMVNDYYSIDETYSLAFIAFVLATGIVISVLIPGKPTHKEEVLQEALPSEDAPTSL